MRNPWKHLFALYAFFAILKNMEERKQAANRNYKDSVFVDLFSEDKKAKENFLSLYNALHSTHLDNVSALTPLRLEQVMYMSFYNDVSYLVDNKMIILAEHQSTINPNMPIRCLEYVVRLYERILDAQERYARSLIKIPTPEFYVFYNGQEEYPNETVLYLSAEFMTKPEHIPLELAVKVLNINEHKGNKILQSCKPLAEYSIFVETVRRNIERDKEHGFENAIKECIQNGILKEYLQRKSKEVINMLIAEYDYATDIAVQRAEERKIAYTEGKSLGLAEGKSLGLAEGKSLGLAEGSRQKAFETARNLLVIGLSIDNIAKATGLTVQEVETLN